MAEITPATEIAAFLRKIVECDGDHLNASEAEQIIHHLARLDAAEARAKRLLDMMRRMQARAIKRHSAAEARVRVLTEALRRAREDMEGWAEYASEYFREKHDLAGDLAAIDAALNGDTK
jgi:uncharacterized protein YigA (DUF484 family)